MMEMISLYLIQTRELKATILASFEAKDWDLLQSSVHKMIPSFSIMGFDSQYENLAKEIQELANQQKETKEMAGLVTKLKMVCSQACTELEVEYNRLKKTQK